MAGSRVRSSWASSVLGDEPTPPAREQPPRKVQTCTHVHDQVTVSIPTFEGRYKPDLYIEWECEINDIFFSHYFSEHKKVKNGNWYIHGSCFALVG